MDILANKKYVEARDKLIPNAEAYADRPEHYSDPATKGRDWVKVFILKMDRLAVEGGLQSCLFHRQDVGVRDVP